MSNTTVMQCRIVELICSPRSCAVMTLPLDIERLHVRNSPNPVRRIATSATTIFACNTKHHCRVAMFYVAPLLIRCRSCLAQTCLPKTLSECSWKRCNKTTSLGRPSAALASRSWTEYLQARLPKHISFCATSILL